MQDSKIIDAYLDKFESLKFSVLPTPLVNLDKLGKQLGINLFCKRDDMTGFAFGGNKTRKLDYLVKDIISKGYDSIVTWGSNQSNWCRMTSAAGAVSGLGVYLVLAGKSSERPRANLLLDHMVNANIAHIDTEDDNILEEECLKIAATLKKEGKNPYYVSVGGSNETGSLGYLSAFSEILKQGNALGINFSDIVVASGSAGTQAGLVAGKIISGWPGRIIGMAVSREKSLQKEKVMEVTGSVLDLVGFGNDQKIMQDSVLVDDSYLGEGYRHNTASCAEAINIFAQAEGIFLDEVYTGKAAAGLIDYSRKMKFRKESNILFIHTGGNIQLFE